MVCWLLLVCWVLRKLQQSNLAPYFAPTGKSEAEQVEAYMARITDGVLPEDRQDAVAGLRDLLVHNSEAEPLLHRQLVLDVSSRMQ